MNLKEVKTKKELSEYYKVPDLVYKGNSKYRSTEDDVMEMLVEKKTVFFKHASIYNYLLKDNGNLVGRFSLIHDEKNVNYVQVAYFECLNGFLNIADVIKKEAKKKYPTIKRILFGFNGHLNYGVGFLASSFDKVPLFGLPYTKKYYLDYFKDMKEHKMVSYKAKNIHFFLAEKFGLIGKKSKEITIRAMNKKDIKNETKLYTNLNNACFQNHPFWADRTWQEDFELFNPFKVLLENENLLIAEDDGKPVAFLLWYPDFNQLTKKGLGVKEFLKFKFLNKIDTVRITEIAVLPEYRRKGIMQALIKECAKHIKRKGYKYSEGGFIFERNKDSISFTKKMFSAGSKLLFKPHRRYVIFEDEL